MTLLRMLAFRANAAGAESEPRRAAPLPRQHAPATQSESAAGTAARRQAGSGQSNGVADAPGRPARSEVTAPRIDGLADWEAWIRSAALGGPVGLLAQHAVPKSFEGDVLTLALKPEHMIFCSDALCRQLQDQLGGAIGRKLRIRILHEAVVETPATRAAKMRSDEQTAAERALADDPIVQDMQRQLGAQIIPGSIRPAGNQA